MISKLYDNCLTTELSTKILEVREDNGLFRHACKDTIFYKEGGGAASDIGMTDEHIILDLKYGEGHIWHLLDARLEGTVFMSMNLHERLRECQIHTAQHLIGVVLGNVYKVETLAHRVGGEENDIESSFEDFADKVAFELQVLCNDLIRDDFEVSIQYPIKMEVSKITRSKNLNHDDPRIVCIGALDYNMCGCIHVPSLRYLQMLYIGGYKKTAKRYRIKYLVGDQLLDYVSRRYEMLDGASRSLAVSRLYVSTGINRLINETRQLSRDIVVWGQKYYEMFGKELGRGEGDAIIHFFDDTDMKPEADVTKHVTENYKKAVIFVAKTYSNVHVVVASHKDMGSDSTKIFKEIVDAYHLEGDGGARLSQGGGMYSEEIIKFVKMHKFSWEIMTY